MIGNYYLLRFEVSGIKNIEKPIEVAFYKKTINNDFDPEQYKIKAVYGENGSGKTAVVTAVKIMQRFLMDKSYVTDNQKVLVDSVNKKTKSGHIECEFYSVMDGKSVISKYYFSFEVREDNRFYVTEESYEIKQGTYTKNNYELVFKTQNGVLVYYRDKKNMDLFKEKSFNLLTQRSFVSFVLEKEIYEMVLDNAGEKNIVALLNLLFFALEIEVSLDEADNHMTYYWKETLQKMDEETFRSQGISMINKIEEDVLWFKTGEKLVPKTVFEVYKNQIAQICSFVKIFKPELIDIEIETRDYDLYYKCNLKMVYKDYTLDSEFESRGIKKIMNLYSHLDAASNGKIVFIDELDSNINDVYLDKIIEHFIYYGKGQLCFTAHNLSPMHLLKGRRGAITFISSINTVHTWANNGNANPENAYKNGFIEDSPFNVDASSFLGIIGGNDEQ